ncbi:hypothetical protein [Salarchaeum japonicum]|uniref:Uncharacterized protein n=1 Tax=Salarchaeum japonicum TaxID=555573 RepID=A0AAV3SYA8_9EURY|nr:hypothetical protein [Salarchaeum japonicum]
MTGEYDGFVSFLEERVGDGLEIVMEVESDSYEILYGEEAAEEYFAGAEDRSVEGVYEEALLESTQAYLDSMAYEHTTYADVMVTDIGVGYQVFLSETRSVIVWTDGNVQLEVPAFIDDCRDRLRECGVKVK